MKKPRGRPFQPGSKFGKGRPKGSRNRPKRPELALLKEYSPHLLGKCISMAMNGDRTAMKLCIERIVPALREATFRLNLPAITSAQDVDKASEKVAREVARGRITPGEGGKVMNILEGRCRIIENVQVESRLEALEQKAESEGERRTG